MSVMKEQTIVTAMLPVLMLLEALTASVTVDILEMVSHVLVST